MSLEADMPFVFLSTRLCKVKEHPESILVSFLDLAWRTIPESVDSSFMPPMLDGKKDERTPVEHQAQESCHSFR